MDTLTIMPNFTIMAEVSNKHYMKNLFGLLRCYCEVIANVEHIDTYRITPKSFWNGMNLVPDVDFLQVLKDNTTTIPANVLTDLEKFKSKFGTITLVGDDCLKISSADVLAEIKHNTKLNKMIYEYDGDLVFFSESMSILHETLQNDLFCPIKFRSFKVKTYLFLNKVKHEHPSCVDKYVVVKGTDPVQAMKALYGNHNLVNEKNLRSILNYKKDQVTDEAITEFATTLINDIKYYFEYGIEISDKANREPFNF